MSDAQSQYEQLVERIRYEEALKILGRKPQAEQAQEEPPQEEEPIIRNEAKTPTVTKRVAAAEVSDALKKTIISNSVTTVAMGIAAALALFNVIAAQAVLIAGIGAAIYFLRTAKMLNDTLQKKYGLGKFI